MSPFTLKSARNQHETGKGTDQQNYAYYREQVKTLNKMKLDLKEIHKDVDPKIRN